MSPRRRVLFPAAGDLPSPPVVAPLGPLVLSAQFQGAGVRTFDLTDSPCPRLVRHLLLALSGLAGVENGQSYVETTAGYTRSIECLADFIAETDPQGAATFDVADLTAQLLETFENRLIAAYEESSRMPYTRLHHVVRLLRLVCEREPDLISPQMQARLTFTTVRTTNAGGGRVDAYPAEIFDAIHAAAMADVRAIRDRMLQGERLAAEGQDPVAAGGGWAAWTVPNALWHVAHRGPLTLALGDASGLSRIKEAGGIGKLNSRFFLSPSDLVPLLTLLICQTGLEPEVASALCADCLVNPARGYVSIRYVKKRAHGYSHKALRVSDGGGLHHPGGLIRLITRLTAYGRRLTGTDLLWTHVLRSGQVIASYETWRQTVLLPFKRAWMHRHGINDISDDDYTLDFRRLRESYKSRRYVQSAGVLDDFTEGHTKRVAARHYADIDEHRQLHEDAVEAGLREALDVAVKPPVVLAGDGTTLSDGPDLAPAEVAAALSGDNDVWLASCNDFYSSPFALKPGTGCPVAIWGCLECPNAVFTTRHLPSILSFLDFMHQQQEQLASWEWQARYASAARRITEGICPQFTAEQLETARAIAEGGDGNLRLPAQILELMT